jgi:hypothetical protein
MSKRGTKIIGFVNWNDGNMSVFMFANSWRSVIYLKLPGVLYWYIEYFHTNAVEKRYALFWHLILIFTHEHLFHAIVQSLPHTLLYTVVQCKGSEEIVRSRPACRSVCLCMLQGRYDNVGLRLSWCGCTQIRPYIKWMFRPYHIFMGPTANPALNQMEKNN